jgi:hypothetical protein
MPFRFITKYVHTYLIDYPVAIVLMVAPFLLKLGKSSPVALWLSVVTRVTALLLPALTDHPTGLVRVIRDWLHLWVDRALGVVSITVPSAFHFTGLDAWYHWVLAAAVLLATSVLNAPEVSAARRAYLDAFGPKSKVEEGAVVRLGGRFFVIAASTGKLMCDGNEIMGISTQVPIHAELEGKRAGDAISFNGREFVIEEVA